LTLSSRLSAVRRTLAGHLPPRARQLINVARGIDQPLAVDALSGARVLVLAPHPDDEIIGCGGSIVRHLERGARVHVVHVTSGERTWSGAGDGGATREREAVAAAVAIGLDADAVEFLRLPDGKLAGHAELAARLRAAVQGRDPDLVYAPWPLDAHADHRAVTAAAASALPASASVALYEVWGPLVPTHVVDITDVIERKTAALGCYETAVRGLDYAHTARGLAAYRSGQGLGGRGYAEAFCVVRDDELLELVSEA
jgi:LmbE family N-acetylglucosaminyl deacetylase